MRGARGEVPARPAALARELERLLADVAGTVDGVVDRPHPPVESLHQLHRGMRRLRHALAIWEALLSDHDRALVRPLAARLQRLARLVGRVRDGDVMIELIEGPSLPRPSRADTRPIARLRARLRDDTRTGRELLRVFLRSERDGHLFEGLQESVEFVTSRGAQARFARWLDEEEVHRREAVRKAHRRARRRPTSVRLHRLRIRVRRLRHLGEVRERLDLTHAGTLPASLRKLQALLGRVHDLDLVLDGLDAEVVRTGWARAVRAERRRVRDAVRIAIRGARWPQPVVRSTGPGAHS